MRWGCVVFGVLFSPIFSSARYEKKATFLEPVAKTFQISLSSDDQPIKERNCDDFHRSSGKLIDLYHTRRWSGLRCRPGCLKSLVFKMYQRRVNAVERFLTHPAGKRGLKPVKQFWNRFFTCF